MVFLVKYQLLCDLLTSCWALWKKGHDGTVGALDGRGALPFLFPSPFACRDHQGCSLSSGTPPWLSSSDSLKTEVVKEEVTVESGIDFLIFSPSDPWGAAKPVNSHQKDVCFEGCLNYLNKKKKRTKKPPKNSAKLILSSCTVPSLLADRSKHVDWGLIGPRNAWQTFEQNPYTF